MIHRPVLPPTVRMARRALSAGAVVLALGVSGCGSSSSATAGVAPGVTPVTAGHSGEVDVLSAGSLDTLMTKVVGPAFHRATGYTLVNTSGGSGTLAADIRNRVARADVFISASPAVNETLIGARNGGWESWYAPFASSPLVLGYYRGSHFAAALRSKPWYEVVTRPGFRLGRTNPTQDPAGVLAIRGLMQTARAQHLPALKRLARETSDEYAEDPEAADLLSGQLDAAFMYEAAANSQNSPVVRLTGVHLAGDYTISLLNHAPHAAAGEAFIRFLLGPAGHAELRADHFTIISPAQAVGTGVPAGVRSVVRP
jgi:molybdate/tungstate transport system substrate-binding protein